MVGCVLNVLVGQRCVDSGNSLSSSHLVAGWRAHQYYTFQLIDAIATIELLCPKRRHIGPATLIWNGQSSCHWKPEPHRLAELVHSHPQHLGGRLNMVLDENIVTHGERTSITQQTSPFAHDTSFVSVGDSRCLELVPSKNPHIAKGATKLHTTYLLGSEGV